MRSACLRRDARGRRTSRAPLAKRRTCGLNLARHHFSCRASAHFSGGGDMMKEVGIGRRTCWRPFTGTAYAGKTLDTIKQRGPARLRGQPGACRASRRPTARATGPGSTSTSARRSPRPSSATRTRSSGCRSTRQQRFTALQSGEIDILVAQHDLDADARCVARPRVHRRHLLRRPGLHGAEEVEGHERQAAEGRDGLRAVRHHDREEPVPTTRRPTTST